jgi:Na+/melibiose symporter-like transporter
MLCRDTAKCPACGWTIDPEAYRCPKCAIYFCYRCRARVGKHESQFQCITSGCSYHGKLVCYRCSVITVINRRESLALVAGVLGAVIAAVAGLVVYWLAKYFTEQAANLAVIVGGLIFLTTFLGVIFWSPPPETVAYGHCNVCKQEAKRA